MKRLNPVTKRNIETSVKEIKIQLKNLQEIRFSNLEMSLFNDAYQLTIDCMTDNIDSILDCTTEEHFNELLECGRGSNEFIEEV